MKKFLHSILFLATSLGAYSQSGEIQGKVVDDKGEPVPFAMVVIIRDMVGKEPTSKGTKANVNGLYTLKGLAAGTYNIMAKSLGKPNAIEIGVQVFAGRPVTVNFAMEQKSNTKKEVVITGKAGVKPPKMIDVFQPKETVIGAAEVKDAAVRDVASIAASTGGVVQEDVGAGLNVGGGRGEGLVYFVDGVKMTGSAAVPPSQIQQIEVITSGVPAKYGDANAGVMSIITKGPSDKLRGSVEGLTSFLDPYGYRLVNANLTGPILRAKSIYDSSNPTSPVKIKGEPILGFSIGGEYQHENDRIPTINGNWKIKDDVYAAMLKNPYRVSNDGTQLLLEQSFLTMDDLERTNSHQNLAGSALRFNGKLDWKVVPNSTNITLGARYEAKNYKDFVKRYALFNYQNNPDYTDKSYNAYIRLYQPLFNADKQVNKIIKNTTMTLQVDATLSGQDYQSPVGKDKPWHYGYIGKFEESRAYSYTRNTDDDGYKVYYAPGQYITFKDFMTANSFSTNGVKFTKGTINPLAAEQTDIFINTYNTLIAKNDASKLNSIVAIENNGGIINGNRASNNIHDLFFPAARVFNGIQKEENIQLRATGTFNFDIQPNKAGKVTMNKHTIEAGFEVEQRINSQYNIGPLTLWSVAQNQLLNTHLNPDNTQNYNPLLIMRNGTIRMRLQDYIKQDSVYFSALDTLLYDKEVSKGDQTNFSKNLRAELFNNDSLTRINIHELDPDKMKLEWFSADELLINGLASGYGYDIYGNKLSTSTNFGDFFTKKDSKGNFLRNVAPFMPRYAAGYIQDRFQLKDLALNVGFRLDYFDPNTQTLIDPFVPQGVRTIAQVEKIGQTTIDHPDNLPSNAAVYVDDVNNPSRVTGYRVGTVWYDKTGKELAGPAVVEAETGGNVKPYLAGNTQEERDTRDMTKSTFNPDLIFKKTTGRFALAPRVNFSFQIDTFALLFAHYDVLNQRPEEDATITTALNYYNLLGRRSSSFINNSNLDFSSTTDLEIGFKQRLSQRSSLTINFQYREYSNQVAFGRYTGAYPAAYNTFFNTDFSTVKSIGLAFEQRRYKNLRLKANYTMSFAEGTGSSRNSQQNLINAGLGNIKVIYPLNWDTRHNFNFSANYRFDSRDPLNRSIPSFVKDFGINLDFNLRSGTPYTQQESPTPVSYMNSVVRSNNLGDINAGSMPWRMNANLKLDKDFNFKFGKIDSSKGGDNRREYGLNIYVQATNIFNSFNVLEVYRYTGDAATDGYLTSTSGVLDYTTKEITATGFGRSFRDLYNVSLEIPEGRNSMYARPRVIQLGAVLSF